MTEAAAAPADYSDYIDEDVAEILRSVEQAKRDAQRTMAVAGVAAPSPRDDDESEEEEDDAKNKDKKKKNKNDRDKAFHQSRKRTGTHDGGSSMQRHKYYCFAKLQVLCKDLRDSGVRVVVLYADEDVKPSVPSGAMNLLPGLRSTSKKVQLSSFRYVRMAPKTQERVVNAVMALAKNFPEEAIL